MSKPARRAAANSPEAALKGLVERIDALDEEIKGLNADKADVYREAKEKGFDPNALRSAVRFLRDPDAAIQRNTATLQLLEMLGWDPNAAALPAPKPAANQPQIEDGTEGATRA